MDSAVRKHTKPEIKLTGDQQRPRLMLCGAWNVHSLSQVEKALSQVDIRSAQTFEVDGREIAALDVAASQLILTWLRDRQPKKTEHTLVNFSPQQMQLLELVRENLPPNHGDNAEEEPLGFFEKIGKTVIEIGAKSRENLEFVGESASTIAESIRQPSQFRIKELFIQIETAFVDAIPIVCLVTFLIGIVIAYLFGIQIEKYGANIFIVDGVSMTMCREMSPILIAIIVAGRSGSAFTAHIGSMKINEELDAMRVLGLSPMRVLVIPRLIALMIAMPLLTFIGDVVGVAGAMVIADLRLGITTHTFLQRLQNVLPIRSFFVGLIKAPVFAIFIAVIGCRMGLNVENNARSVGMSTTSTVVQSIVSVILLNAAFAIIFSELRI